MAFRERKNCDRRHGGARKKLLLWLAGIAAGLFVAWIVAVPLIVRSRLAALTGCPVEADTIRINPLGASIRLVNFRLHNPPGFAATEFVDLALLDINADLFSLGGDVLKVPHATIDLEKITLVTGKDGTTNAAVVRRNIEAALGTDTTEEEAERKFHIGELVIKIGSVELVDYSRGGAEPVRRTVPIRANHHFTDVTDPKVIIRPLLADLARANAGELLGSVGGLLPAPFREALTGPGGLLQDGGKRAGETMKKLIDSLPIGR